MPALALTPTARSFIEYHVTRNPGRAARELGEQLHLDADAIHLLEDLLERTRRDAFDDGERRGEKAGYQDGYEEGLVDGADDSELYDRGRDEERRRAQRAALAAAEEERHG